MLSQFRFLIFEVTFDLLILSQFELKMNLNRLQGSTSLPIETQTVKRPPRTAVSGPEIFGSVREHFDRVANFESGPESKSRSGIFGPPEVR